MSTQAQASTQGNRRIYALRPFHTAKATPGSSHTPRPLPPRQPLPSAVLDPQKPLLKLGLDVHLAFIMAVAQKDHSNPQAPRKFTNLELVAQVKRWVADGFQVICVQESCGFGFVLHRQLVEAGAQSFLITPIAMAFAQVQSTLQPGSLRPQGTNNETQTPRTPPIPRRFHALRSRTPTMIPNTLYV